MSLYTFIEKGKDILSSDKKTKKDISVVEKEKIIDIKTTFQNTKDSLKILKESISSETTSDIKKQQNTYFADYIKNLLGFSVLSDDNKQQLQHLDSKITNNELLEQNDVDLVISIVSDLEKKSELLNEIDRKKIKELQKILDTNKSSLLLLKNTIKKVVPTLEDVQKKAIEKIKSDLEEKWWSKWLAGPIYDYLMDKYIYKESISSFKNWLMGSVGISIVGLFVSKDVRKLLKGIDTLSLEELSSLLGEPIVGDIKNLGDLGAETFEQEKERLSGSMLSFFEQKFGRTIDKDKFTLVCSEWFDERKSKIALGKKVEEFNQAMFAKNGEFDLFGETIGLLVAPPKAILDLFFRLTTAGIISWDELMIDGVMMPSGEMILHLGQSSVGLFSNTMKTVFGSMSIQDLSEYIKEHKDRLNLDSQMALWGLLYRRGGWFWTMTGYIGKLAGEGLSLMFMERSGGDVAKMSAYFEGGVMGNFQKELKVFDQLEKSLKSSGMFKEVTSTSGFSHLDDITKTMKNNLILFDIVKNNNNFTEIERLLQSNGLTDVLIDLKKNTSWLTDISKLRTATGDIIETSMNKSLTIAENSLDTWKKFAGKNLKFPRAKFPYEEKLISQLRDYSKLQGKMLQDDAIFNKLQNFFRKFGKGKQLSYFVESSDQIKFCINNVDDAKMFFDNIKYIGRHSPEILKTLFKGFPLIMVGNEVINKLSDPENKDPKIHAMRDAFLYLTPIVGPIKLISDGLHIKDGEFSSLSSAGVGVGLVVLDGFYFGKAITSGVAGGKGVVGGVKGVIKFMTMPVRDSISFIKSLGEGTYYSMKMFADGARIIKAGKGAELGLEGLRFLKKTGINIAGAALLVYLGYTEITNYFETQEEKKQFAEITKMDRKALEEKIKEDWPKLNDEQKSDLIKFATASRMGFDTFDQIRVKKNENDVSIKFMKLVNYDEMKETEQDLQEALSGLEVTKNIRLSFALDGGDIKEELKNWKKNKFSDESGSFDESSMKAYLLSMGYTPEIVEKFIKIS